MRLLALLAVVALLAWDPALTRADEYYEEEADAETEYEYEYEEEVAGASDQPVSGGFESAQTAAEVEVEVFPQGEAQRPASYGFNRNLNSNLMKIKRPLVDETYLNETSIYYDCIKREDAWILALEPNATDYDDEYDIMKQIENMKKKVDQAVSAANAMADSLSSSIPGRKSDKDSASPKEMDGAVNIKTGLGKDSKETTDAAKDPKDQGSTSKENATASALGNMEEAIRKNKRMSFREKQELRQKIRREKDMQREKARPKFRLGAACETLVCGACKAVVSEFAQAVLAAVNSSEIRYIEQVLNGGFCESKTIRIKYTDIVGDVCNNVFMDETQGYKEALVMRLEQEEDWEGVARVDRVYLQQKDVCTSIGACTDEQWRFQSEPEHKTQEQWDERCFVCQAFATDLEERVQLTRHVTERSIVAQVRETCGRLQLPEEYREICEELVEGKLLDDIAWLAKVHGESVARKAKGEQKFSDKLCEEIDWCKPWLDPTKLKEKEAADSMEAVFF